MRVVALVLLVACNDYDLQGPKDQAEPPAQDTGEPVEPPSEDPDIEVTPASVDFGNVLRDCPSEPVDVTITNRGMADLVVSEIAVDGSAASLFEHDGAPPTLAYGERYTFQVSFTPSAWNSYTAELRVASNDPDEAEVGVPLAGVGADAATYEETFTQEYYEEVDVLWVIDNSCSMSEEVDRLKRNFADFIGAFVTLGLDYHMGVVTTDMNDPSQSGRLQGSPTYIDASTADPESAFNARASVGSGGSADEKGLEAARAALTDPLASGHNAGFLRSGSALAVVVVSDENDSSSLSPGSFASWFEGLRSDPAMTTFSAIVGDRGLGCTEIDWTTMDSISASGGDDYIDVADATDGVFASICTEDFDVALSNISQASAGMLLSFPLSETPSDVSRIEVEVDGVSVDYDGAEGFTYDSADNAIDFHGTAVPGPGAEIDVRYPISGTCT